MAFFYIQKLDLFLGLTNFGRSGTVAPQAFIAKLKRDNELFRSTMHQDAHEFLNYLINRVVEDLEEEEKLGREERKRLREQEREKLKLLTTTANGSANPVEDCTSFHFD